MLTFELTDLAGTVIARFDQHRGGETTIENSESCLAKVTLSVHDAKAKKATPLNTMLRVMLDEFPDPVFHGVVLKPSWKSNDNSQVEINAHDQSMWWKRNYHRYGDASVDYGYNVSGVGLRTLAESAIPLPTQIARGIPTPGLLWGTDDALGFKFSLVGGVLVLIDGDGPRPANLKIPVANEGLWGKSTRGQNVYESIRSLSDIAGGPEWRMRHVVGLPTGYYAYLDTSRRFGTDKTATVVFHRGHGRVNNCKDFDWDPDGNAVRNYWVEVFPGGEDNRADSQKKGLAHSEASWLAYGIYQGWESSGNEDSNAILVAKAKEFVRYYKNPVNYFAFNPLPNAPRYKYDYDIGDSIRGTCEDGYMSCDLVGRVRKVTLKQPPSEEMVTSLECVPDVLGANQVGDEGG